MTGVLHGISDSKWGRRNWLFKPLAIIATYHHLRPLELVNQTFLTRNVVIWTITAALSGTWAAVLGVSFFWGAMTAAGLLLSEIHRWAHLPSKAPRIVRYLQATGVIQSPTQHKRHHKPPYKLAYCLISDWCNPILDRMRKWAQPSV